MDLNKAYATKDLYRTAALVLSSGRQPDSHYLERDGDKPFVFWQWTSRQGLPIKELEAHELKIEPLAFKRVHRDFTIRVLEIIDNLKNGDATCQKKPQSAN